MLQEILALLIVFSASVYTLVQFIGFFRTKTPKGVCGGCTNCNIGKELNKKSHHQSFPIINV